jgi:hypothetical protein
MSDEAVFAICERVAEFQALLHDHLECGKHSAAEVIAKAQSILSEDGLLRAMWEVGYFQASFVASMPLNLDGSSR